MSTNRKNGGPDQAIISMDLSGLEVKAGESDEKEAYHHVSSGDGYRLGTVVSVSPNGRYVYSIELLVRAFAGESELQVPNMERTAQLCKQLKDLGYSIRHEDDGWLSCERTLQRDEVMDDCAVLTTTITAFITEERGLDGVNRREG